jgi:hypothetical protein
MSAVDEPFDFFDELNENASLRRGHWEEIKDQWNIAMESANQKVIQTTLDAISLAQVKTQIQIRKYEGIPSQRMLYQDEAWLARAMSADGFYGHLLRTLSRHAKIAAQAATAEIESQKAERVKLQTDLEILKARVKIATIRYELRRTGAEDRRLIMLLRQTGVIKAEDMPDLMAQVRTMEPSAEEKRARHDLNRWISKLAEAEDKLRAGCGPMAALADSSPASR